MRNEKILVGCDGEYKNVLLFLSSLCITEEDCQQSIRTLDTILTSFEVSNSEELFNFIYTSENPGPSTRYYDIIFFFIQLSQGKNIFLQDVKQLTDDRCHL